VYIGSVVDPDPIGSASFCHMLESTHRLKMATFFAYVMVRGDGLFGPDG
jgi:hypothetical protein